MTTLTDYTGRDHEIECLGCAMRESILGAPPVYRSELFDLHQDFETPIPGFLVLATLRHVRRIDELTAAETREFIEIIKQTRRVLHDEFGITNAHVIQNDSAAHFHTWIFPRYGWMDEQFGTKLDSVKKSVVFAREHHRTPEHIRQVNETLDKFRSLLKGTFQ